MKGSSCGRSVNIEWKCWFVFNVLLSGSHSQADMLLQQNTPTGILLSQTTLFFMLSSCVIFQDCGDSWRAVTWQPGPCLLPSWMRILTCKASVLMVSLLITRSYIMKDRLCFGPFTGQLLIHRGAENLVGFFWHNRKYSIPIDTTWSKRDGPVELHKPSEIMGKSD